MTPYGKVTKHKRTQHIREAKVSTFQAGDHKAARNIQYSITKTNKKLRYQKGSIKEASTWNGQDIITGGLKAPISQSMVYITEYYKSRNSLICSHFYVFVDNDEEKQDKIKMVFCQLTQSWVSSFHS